MKNLLNPRWLLLISTLPVVLLFIIFGSQYQVIKTLLTETHLHYWKIFSLALAGIGTFNLFFLAYAIVKDKKISLVFSALNLLLHILFVYAYLYNAENIIPFSIPGWMIPENMEIFALAFLMPAMGYSLLTLVVILTPDEKDHKAWLNFLVAIAIPLLGYLISMVIFPILNGFNLNTNFVIIITVSATVAFLFFLCRGFYIIGRKKSATWKKYALIWKIPFTLLMPVVGLMVNNGFIFNSFSFSNNGIFGNFGSVWFYVLAVINGVALCIPDIQNKTFRLFLFVVRSICFAYTFYFFMVFLPFLPLSLMAVIAVGLGFLMLTPIILFVIHTHQLSNDFSFLRSSFSAGKLTVVAFLSFLLIPVCIAIDFHNDKLVLHKALDYVFQPDYQKNDDIDISALRKTMDVLKHQKDRRGEWILANSTPYLSTFYNWLVLDNLTLSEGKINKIEKVFFNSALNDNTATEEKNEQVAITKTSVRSHYDEQKACWISNVDLSVTNADKNSFRSQEYNTVFELPTGCWISDYYLIINGKKEMGILAEKKAAQWVYNNIVSEKRDPGILYYLNGNNIMFRVFPIASGETRQTGIEFIHKEPVTLSIDGQQLFLGDSTAHNNIVPMANERFAYVSAAAKSKLPKIIRKPYYHFLIDASENSAKQKKQLADNISKFISNNYLQPNQLRFSYVNAYTHDVPKNQDWKKQFYGSSFQGGYFLDRAIRQTLVSSFENNQEAYPVMIAASANFGIALLDKDFSDLKMTCPDGDYFYELGHNGQLIPHSLWNRPADTVLIKDSTIQHPHPVCVYNQGKLKQLLPDDGQPSIVFNNLSWAITEKDIKEKNINSAVLMQAKVMVDALHPNMQEADWQDEVRHSFRSKIMLPSTSYLVVENESQKAALKRKQEQVLSGKKSLDAGEEVTRMSEPEWWILGLLMTIFIIYKERKRKRLIL